MSDREKMIDILESAESAAYWNSDDRGFIEKIADHLIANGVTVQQWIPVSEMLPNRREDVLVTDGESLCTAWLSRGNAWIRSYTSAILDGITHWMPLPEPPKGEQE